MTVPQITVRLAPETKDQFDRYAASFGLGSSELAKLLIVRETKLKCLATLKKMGRLPLQERQPRGSAVALKTVTAHFSKVLQVRKFDSYAANCGLNRNIAGKLILEAELREKWLEKAIMSMKPMLLSTSD